MSLSAGGLLLVDLVSTGLAFYSYLRLLHVVVLDLEARPTRSHLTDFAVNQGKLSPRGTR